MEFHSIGSRRYVFQLCSTITFGKLLIDARDRGKLSMEGYDIRVTEQRCLADDAENDTNIEHVTGH